MAKNKESLLRQIEQLKKLMDADNYETKVPEAVRHKNTEKLTKLANEVEIIENGMKQLELMK